MPDKTMSLPMHGRMPPLSPDSLSPHEHLSYPGTGKGEEGQGMGVKRSGGGRGGKGGGGGGGDERDVVLEASFRTVYT